MSRSVLVRVALQEEEVERLASELVDQGIAEAEGECSVDNGPADGLLTIEIAWSGQVVGTGNEFRVFAGNTGLAPIADVKVCDPATSSIVESLRTFLRDVSSHPDREVVEILPGALGEEGGEALHLHGDRFVARVPFRTQQGDGLARVAVAAEDDGDSGVFSFFVPENWEVMLKVLDGCSINGHFWVFGAAATDVEHTIVVEEPLSGRIWAKANPPSTFSPAFGDVTAFPCW